MSETKNYFEELNSINVSDKVEKKNGLSYLSWTYAWGETKKRYPEANYVIYESTLPNGYVVNYFTDGTTGWVKTGVIINGIEHIEELPIMDYKNRSIPLAEITSFDVNKTIQRSLTKAIARHGLGLYVYAGEDLPDDEETAKQRASERLDYSKTTTTQKSNYNGENKISDKTKALIYALMGKLTQEKLESFNVWVKREFVIESIDNLKQADATKVIEMLRKATAE